MQMSEPGGQGAAAPETGLVYFTKEKGNPVSVYYPVDNSFAKKQKSSSYKNWLGYANPIRAIEGFNEAKKWTYEEKKRVPSFWLHF